LGLDGGGDALSHSIDVVFDFIRIRLNIRIIN